jgi:hypothetical protein
MNYFIIAFVVLSLVGSVMWVMPTKRDKFLAALRMDAKRLGFQVQLLKLKFPREKGVVEPREVSTIAYRLLRGKIALSAHNDWQSWRVVKCETNACEGLLRGWGWVVGERVLSEGKLDQLNTMLANLPDSVIAIESTPVHASAFWGEQDEKQMHEIQQSLNQMIALSL